MSGVTNLGYNGTEKPIFTEANTFEIDDAQNRSSQDNIIVAKNENRTTIIDKISKWLGKNKSHINLLLKILLHVVVVVYFSYATYYYLDRKNNFVYEPPPANATERCTTYCGMQWCDGYGMMVLVFGLTYLALIYYLILVPQLGQHIYRGFLRPLHESLTKFYANRISKIGTIIVVLVAVIVYLIFDTAGSRDRLRSLVGIIGILCFGLIFSKHPSKINYRPVFCGLFVQFLLGIFCIRWDVGRSIFQCLGDKVKIFLDYSKEGAEFVYGNLLVRQENVFAFGTLPAIFFFSFFISILYYLEVMQWVIKKLGWILQTILGTTVCESVICAANIFIGMTETPLLIAPYMKYLTYSEIHVIMASGFATTSGTVLGVYISFGAEAAHLITSSVMAAPATLAFTKLFFPEVEESQTSSDNLTMEKSTDTSILDAASNGAFKAVGIVAAVMANIICFVSFVAFLNGMVNWLGWLVGLDITFELIFAKIFIPLAWSMGIPWEDCDRVASVIATKTIINEFAAYRQLGILKEEGLISLRSSAIATYAVCGFANPSSVGIMIGALGAMCPEKKSVLVSVALRAFISGSLICFLTASIAGLLLTDDMIT